MPFDDDASLVGGIELVRVLVDRNWFGKRDDGSERASSAAFTESNNENSCFLLAETNLALVAAKFPDKKIAIVTAAAARDAGFIIARDDEGGDGIPGHVLLIQRRERTRSKQHVRLARQLGDSARIVAIPEIG
jgi:hypothetical protein